jgi:hypothetical protein
MFCTFGIIEVTTLFIFNFSDSIITFASCSIFILLKLLWEIFVVIFKLFKSYK